MGNRIPHGDNATEIRFGFQRLEASVGILTDGTSGQYLIGQGVGVYPVWIDPVTLTAGSGLTGGGDISADRTFDLDINGLSVATIVAGDFVPFWDITATATNKKTTFANFEAAIDHGNLAGIADDDHTIYSLANGTRDFTGVVVGVDPVNSNHLVTKEYVDSSINFVFEYFLTGDASDIGGIYYDMLDTHTGDATVDLDSAALSTGDDQALVNFATISSEPGATLAHRGIHGLHFHAMKVSGTKPVQIYWELYIYETDTTETLIGTSEISSLLPGIDTELDLHHTQAIDVTMNDTDRFVVKIFANVGATGSAVVVRISVEGDTASHLNVPVSTETLSSIYLRQDGTKALTGNMSVDGGITIDGRDLSVDGTKLDTIETNADVTDATNVAAAGAAMSGGAFHDGFSDYVGNEHIDHSGVSITAGNGLTGGGDITTTRTVDLDINGLSVASIAAGDFVPFWDITATATNKKITFANFEAALTHDNLISGTIADHDTTATGANLTSLTDDSMVNSLHRHSELSASDGTPDKVIQIDQFGQVGFNAAPEAKIHFSGTGNEKVLFDNRLSLSWKDSGGTIREVFTSYDGIVYFDSRVGNMSFRTNTGGAVTWAMTILATNQHVGIGVGSSEVVESRLEVQTGTSEGQQAITIDQNDADKAFIDFQGTSAASTANNISTWTTGNSIQGFTRQEINGTEYWMPYYDAPTS